MRGFRNLIKPRTKPRPKLKSKSELKEIYERIQEHFNKTVPKNRLLSPFEIQILIYEIVNTGISPKELFHHSLERLRHYKIFAYELENPETLAKNFLGICRFLKYHYNLKVPLFYRIFGI
jgi:hypothetical protein